jgi:hypothetical protein
MSTITGSCKCAFFRNNTCTWARACEWKSKHMSRRRVIFSQITDTQTSSDGGRKSGRQCCGLYLGRVLAGVAAICRTTHQFPKGPGSNSRALLLKAYALQTSLHTISRNTLRINQKWHGNLKTASCNTHTSAGAKSAS